MNPIHKKLRLQENQTVAVINQPKDFLSAIKPLPKGVKILATPATKADHIYWFVKTAAEVKKGQSRALNMLQHGNMLWIMHPKGSSGIQTDLTRDKGWESLTADSRLSWVSYISFNEIWTAVGLRLKTEADKKREEKPQQERLIFQYADSKTKTIRLPEDLEKTLGKNKKAKQVWDSLAFSHRREYVEWIITAKRTETREARLKGTIEKLLNGRKNPTDKG